MKRRAVRGSGASSPSHRSGFSVAFTEAATYGNSLRVAIVSVFVFVILVFIFIVFFLIICLFSDEDIGSPRWISGW
jgi:hypothetical protein